MNEKLFSLLVSLVLLITLSACGSTAGARASESEQNSGPSNMQADSPDPQTTEDDSNDSPEIEVQPIPPELAPEDSHIVTLESGSTSMRVLWTVDSYVISKNATWGVKEAEAMLFKPLDVTDREIIFDGQTCQGVTFQRETVSTTEYLSNVWKITPQDLGIDEQEVQVIKTNCSLPGFQEYMRLSDRRLIVPINGIFFFFDPAVAY